MKYITAQLPSEIAPVAILFSPYVAHKTIADSLKLKPEQILSAGFVRFDGERVETAGFSTSLSRGPAPQDTSLILMAIAATNREYPARPRTASPFPV